METGFRYDNVGQTIAKNVIHTLVVRYNGAEIFRAEMGSGIAANPYLEFHTVAAESGELEFSWADDAGARGAARASITVVG
jgi:sulfur-oxidizing protein SoxZ